MAWKPPRRSELRDRFRFERRTAPIDDGYGNTQSGWEPFVPARRVRLLPTLGGERVQADRLAGISAWTLDVPADRELRQVNNDCRAVDDRDPSRTFAIRSSLDLEGRGRWLTMTLEKGGVDG